MKPILFNTESIRALLSGRKSVTRRVVKPQPVFREGETGTPVRCDDGNWCFKIDQYNEVYDSNLKPPYQPGDILYVREAWGTYNGEYYLYRADYPDDAKTYDYDGHICDLPIWRPSIHMPKEAARLFLRVTGVRVEQLQDITEEQAVAEGVYQSREDYGIAIYAFSGLWDSTIKKAKLPLYGWAANPWVWVIEFEQIRREEALKGGDPT